MESSARGNSFFSFGESAWASGKLYWSDWSSNKIQSASLDGTGVVDIATGLSNAKGDVALDLENMKVFWIDNTAGVLQKSNLDGSSIETLVTGIGSGGRGLDLDVANGHVYYGDYSGNYIKRANLDGSADGLTFRPDITKIVMEATTLRLRNIDFPGSAQVRLNSLKGGIDGRYPNFGTVSAAQQIGRVNFIENIKSGGNLLHNRAAFDQHGRNIQIGKIANP